MSKKSVIALVLLLVLLAAVGKSKSSQGSKWQGLTESEARSKLDAKLPDRIPADRRALIADKMVAKMRASGAIVEDPAVDDCGSEQAGHALSTSSS